MAGLREAYQKRFEQELEARDDVDHVHEDVQESARGSHHDWCAGVL